MTMVSEKDTWCRLMCNPFMWPAFLKGLQEPACRSSANSLHGLEQTQPAGATAQPRGATGIQQHIQPGHDVTCSRAAEPCRTSWRGNWVAK